MKYVHKCPTCNKQATRKYKNVYFCDTCAKEMRKHKATAVFKDTLIGSFNGLAVYGYSVVKLK